MNLWWRCEAWATIRKEHGVAIRSFSPQWPPCLAMCAIMPLGLKVDNVGKEQVVTGEAPTECQPKEASCLGGPQTRNAEEDNDLFATGPYGEALIDGRIVVFTDGACKNNQNKLLRRAGVDGFWANGHPFNFGAPLRAGEHTNNRAELMAVVHVLRLEVRPEEIRTDSK